MISFARILVCALLLHAALPATAASAVADPPSNLPRTLPLDAMIGQMIMVGFRGTGEDPALPEMAALLTDVRAGRIGGVILFDLDWQSKQRGRNITSLAQVAALTSLLQKNASLPLFIAVDQEGGKVRRLRPDHGFPDTPSARDMGLHEPADTRNIARAMGQALRKVGINVNFAPVADIAVNPKSPAIAGIGRAFSADPETAAVHAESFASGLAEAGIVSSYKHFPGHGSAGADSHYKLTDITDTWSEKELLPYTEKYLKRDAPIMVMTGHLRHKGLDPDLPASLSRAITTGLLRDKLGWQGVIVTDDLEMGAVDLFHPLEQRVLLAIYAGADIILFGNNILHHPEQGRRVHAIICQLAAEGIISPERIAKSWQRIRALKEKIAARQ